MRERYLANESFDGFSNYDFLELMLFYAQSRCNTNPCAHLLLDRFDGSLKKVFEASVDELCSVKGMGKSSAVLIKMFNEALRRYSAELSVPTERYDHISKVRDYLHHLFLGKAREELQMLLFNDRMNLLDCSMISTGSVNSAEVPIRLMVDKIVQKNATAIILAHNHPNGLAVPSEADYQMTDELYSFFDTMNVVLIEHFVVSEQRLWPIMRDRYPLPRFEHSGTLLGSKFFEGFYEMSDEDLKFCPLFDEK